VVSISRGSVFSPPIFTTPPQTRKRKAPNTFEDRAVTAAKSSKKESAAQLETPTTPLTELDSPIPQPMDSDDEFMSDASSQEEEDFEGTQDSEAGSVGDGQPNSILCSPHKCLSQQVYTVKSWLTLSM
jgi:hypothetical protein